MSSALLSEAWTWGPSLTGLTLGVALSGVVVGQFIFYVQTFPQDTTCLKGLVLTVFILDSAQTVALIWAHHHYLIGCRSNDSPGCLVYIPAPMIFIVFVAYCVPFMVQSFYAHRVWIISGQNRIITSTVLLFALGGLVSGVLCMVELFHPPRAATKIFRGNKFVAISAIASAICDAIITTSIIYYLRLARRGLKWRGNYLKKLNAIFVQMGLFSCIIALAAAVLYYIRGRKYETFQYMVAVPGTIISKVYANSMLSVLNARKRIRDERQAEDEATIELPTIDTIR